MHRVMPRLSHKVCRGLVQVVVRGRTLDWLRTNQDKVLATPLHQALLYGTARYYFSLQQQVSEYLAKPLRNKDQDRFHADVSGRLPTPLFR
jgi:hypothetical protein